MYSFSDAFHRTPSVLDQGWTRSFTKHMNQTFVLSYVPLKMHTLIWLEFFLPKFGLICNHALFQSLKWTDFAPAELNLNCLMISQVAFSFNIVKAFVNEIPLFCSYDNQTFYFQIMYQIKRIFVLKHSFPWDRTKKNNFHSSIGFNLMLKIFHVIKTNLHSLNWPMFWNLDRFALEQWKYS